MGNIRSVFNAFKKLGANVHIVCSPSELEGERLVIPGVGAFGDGMRNLKPFIPAINQAVKMDVPTLGICLGLQTFFEQSEEMPGVAGLGLMKGKVVKVKTLFKLPHIGWNMLNITKADSLLFRRLTAGYVYFVHSYQAMPVEDVVSATVEYGDKVTAAVEAENLFGVQFHPEKSGVLGLRILKNFLEL